MRTDGIVQTGGETKARPRRAAALDSLSGRLLALTLAFVFIAEALILPPSLATFHEAWLRDRADAGQIAALALEAGEGQRVQNGLETRLVENAGLWAVAHVGDGGRVVTLGEADVFARADVRTIDLRSLTFGGSMREAFVSLAAPPTGGVRVVTLPRLRDGRLIEVVAPNATLRDELWRYAFEVMLGGALVSAVVGALVYATLQRVFVAPMRALTLHVEAFRRSPQDETIAMHPSGRRDEIGRAEEAIAVMEDQLRAALRQRERLASLGETVAKLSHDLRASLATAQLLSDRLAESQDPAVRQSAPRLARAIARAAGLAQAAMRYGKAEEPPVRILATPLRAALEDAAAEALAAFPALTWRNFAPETLSAQADPDLLHRILTNLMRNAAQAIEAQPGRSRPGEIAATATATRDDVLIRIVDDGPGVPEAVRARLFAPFSGGGGGGVGLGLAIARELARAQGGEVALAASSPEGSAFEIRLKIA